MGVAKKANFRKEILAWFTVILGVTLEGQNMRLSSYNGQTTPLGDASCPSTTLGCSVG